MVWTIDAYDWVMVPNVYCMSQHADGGMMMNKPYFSSSNYILNMSELTYLDSSALGMLLLLKDYAQKDVNIAIVNCIPEVYKILEIANFDRLFAIKTISE